MITLDRTVNLVEERIDLAVRIGNVIGDSLVARKLGVCRSVICASKAYVKANGQPLRRKISDSIAASPMRTSAAPNFACSADGQTLRIPVKRTTAEQRSCGHAPRSACRRRHCNCPPDCVSADLVSGALVRLLPDYEPEPLGIRCGVPVAPASAALLRTMVDFLADRMKGEVAPWDRVIGYSGKASSPR